jgi:hypothetical protein
MHAQGGLPSGGTHTIDTHMGIALGNPIIYKEQHMQISIGMVQRFHTKGIVNMIKHRYAQLNFENAMPRTQKHIIRNVQSLIVIGTAVITIPNHGLHKRNVEIQI